MLIPEKFMVLIYTFRTSKFGGWERDWQKTMFVVRWVHHERKK
ncbi:MAG: hypothetical protein PHF31_07540 [Methylobacter sp.]|nr:hypothetical protein [Methylobacter sp.]